jgi:hypothetical protein
MLSRAKKELSFNLKCDIIRNENEPNEALEGTRMLVTNRAFSSLREGTIRAKHPCPSA